jgi:acyl-coenzyme A synthetase/AMP-(fatty) acid ligase
VFRPAPGQPAELPNPELAVWSGDIVRRDAEGYLYFVGRRDEMIKSSGYRISPTEVEEIAYATGSVREAAAFGIPDDRLGERIVLVVTGAAGTGADCGELRRYFLQMAPPFMVPSAIFVRDVSLPRTANGKLDRQRLRREIASVPG